jgi:hypothetical protein
MLEIKEQLCVCSMESSFVTRMVIGCKQRYSIKLLLYYAQQDAKPENKGPYIKPLRIAFL